MNFRENWRVASVLSNEVLFRSALEMSAGRLNTKSEELGEILKRVRRSSRFNKYFLGFSFLLIGAIMGATLGFSVIREVSDQALFTTVYIGTYFLSSLGFLVVFGLFQNTILFSSKVVRSLSTLPISHTDIQTISLLTFFRLVDIPVVAILTSFPIAFYLVSQSLISTIALGFFNILNVAFSLSLMLWLSKLFYERIQSTTSSRIGNLFRTFFIFAYGFAILLAYNSLNFLFDLVFPYLLQLVVAMPQIAFLFAILYPFTFGYVLSWIQSPTLVVPLILGPAILASIIYGILIYRQFRRAGSIIHCLGVEDVVFQAPTIAKPVTLNTVSSWQAIIRKDLKLLTRTPAYAGLLAVPLSFLFTIIPEIISGIPIEITTIFPYISLVAFGSTTIGNFWLGIEASGMDYTITLPISTKMVLRAKSLFVLILYLANIVILTILFLIFQTPVNFWVYFILIVSGLNIFSSVLISLTFVSRRLGDGRITAFNINQNLVTNIISLILGSIFSILPLVLYFNFLLIFRSFTIGAILLFLTSAFLLLIAETIARKALRD